MAPSSQATTGTIGDIDQPSSVRPVGCNQRTGDGYLFDHVRSSAMPIDNASITGGSRRACRLDVGVIAPTGTTCSLYRDGTRRPSLAGLQYTPPRAATLINAVSPGVFFYYTKISGDAGDGSPSPRRTTARLLLTRPSLSSRGRSSSMTQSPARGEVDGHRPTVRLPGRFPPGGDYIIGVKYGASSLKGQAPSILTAGHVLVRNDGGRRSGRHRRVDRPCPKTRP